MGNAVLTIKMPKNCYYYCPLTRNDTCVVTGRSIVGYLQENCRPSWCPLKEISKTQMDIIGIEYEKKEKEIHFYTYQNDSFDTDIIKYWEQTKEAIEESKDLIKTTQIGLLSTSLFKAGYRIFIHESDIDNYEIKLGDDNESTGREIKMSHNLFKLWENGEFNK